MKQTSEISVVVRHTHTHTHSHPFCALIYDSKSFRCCYTVETISHVPHLYGTCTILFHCIVHWSRARPCPRNAMHTKPNRSVRWASGGEKKREREKEDEICATNLKKIHFKLMHMTTTTALFSMNDSYQTVNYRSNSHVANEWLRLSALAVCACVNEEHRRRRKKKILEILRQDGERKKTPKEKCSVLSETGKGKRRALHHFSNKTVLHGIRIAF